jgi:FkbM family methyltransferase
MDVSLRALRNNGFSPRRCLNVGAYEGEWAQMFRSIFPQAHVLMIEAQESKLPRLGELAAASDGMLQVEIALLAAVDGREFAFHEMATGSSVMEEQGYFPRTTIKKTSRTLDAVTASVSGFETGVDFIKLDVQGYELEILKGATRTLAQCQAVLMEASFLPINEGCPLIYEVMTFMHDRGFRPIDICGLARRKDGALWQTDLLFLRNDSPFHPTPRLTPENW